MNKYLLSIFFIVGLVGCGSTPTKDPTKVTLQNTSHKKDGYSMSAVFASVRGDKLKVGPFTTPNKATHIVDAGRASIHSYVTLSGKKYSGVQAADFIFNMVLVEGETYRIVPEVKEGCIFITIFDSNNAPVVSDQASPWLGVDSVQRIIADRR